MSPSARQVADLASNRRSDPVFGIAAGLYLALVLSPAVLLAVSVAGWTEPAVLYGAFLATGVGALALAGLVFSSRPGWLPGSARRRWRGSPPRWAWSSRRVRWPPSSTAAGFRSSASSWACSRRSAGSRSVGSRIRATRPRSWRVPPSSWRSKPAGRRPLETGCTPSQASWPGSPPSGGSPASSRAPTGWRPLGQLGFSLGLVTSVAARSRTYRVTSAGLAVDEPLRTRVVPWSAFEGWDRTDDAIVVRRPRRVDVRVAADDLEDPDAVADALARYLGPSA